MHSIMTLVYKKIKTIRHILMTKNEITSNYEYIEITPSNTCGMKYGPLSSVDVESYLP
jgi:hypothetical protein